MEAPMALNERRPVPDRTKVVPRPTPKAQTEDPRAFQIGQMRRRFKPTESEDQDSTIMTFDLVPSDPDFPYDIEALECMLRIPKSYPSSGKPTLTVKNKDIPRGFQINIERGYDTIAAGAPEATLLGLMNRLDKQLETILAGKVAETVKIVSNTAQSQKSLPKSEPKPLATPIGQTHQTRPSEPTPEQKLQASAKRQSDVRQLEARFSRLPSFNKSTDGLTFTLPLDSPKKSTWPKSLRSLHGAKVTVPELYPIIPARLQLDSDAEEARAVETAFQQRSEKDQSATITQQYNYLSQNLKQMATVESKTDGQQTRDAPEQPEAAIAETPGQQSEPNVPKDQPPHLYHIPRPVE